MSYSSPGLLRAGSPWRLLPRQRLVVRPDRAAVPGRLLLAGRQFWTSATCEEPVLARRGRRGTVRHKGLAIG